MNKSDSERVAQVLENQCGFKPAGSEAESDLVVLNTCTVRQSAENRAVGKVKSLSNKKIILTGCLARQKDFYKKFPEIDLLLDIKDLSKLPKKLKSSKQELNDGISLCHEKRQKNYLSITPKYESSFSAYIPISTGCDNYCAYCVVPYVRGPETSRKAEEILAEAKDLIKKDYKEITLVGQNVNSYKDGKTDFTKLLKKIARYEGNFRIFFITSHPKDFDEKLIDVVKKHPKLCRYFHIPFQSGSNKILEKMNRKYSREDYLQIISQIRKEIPDAAISTDVIVGFPEETNKEFGETANLMREVKFDMAYIAQYSPRPQTEAFKLKDSVPKTEKKRREAFLTNILKKTSLKKNKKLIGKTVRVLVNNIKPEKNKFKLSGKTDNYKTVVFGSDKNLIGEFVNVKIIDAMAWGVRGIKST